MKKQIKQIFNPLSGSFDSIQTSDATKDASQLMLLTADESISDWTNITSDFSISKVDPLFGDASYVLEMNSLSAATHKLIPVDIGFRGTTVALTFNYVMLDGAARVALLDQNNEVIEGARFDVPSANGKEKFSTTVFIPNYVTGIRFQAEARDTVAGGSFKFDNVQLSSDLLKSVDIEGDYQQVVLSGTSITPATNLDSLAKSLVRSNSQLFTLSSSGVTLLRNADVSVTISSSNGSSAVVDANVFVNGTVVANDNSQRTGTTRSSSTVRLFLKKGDIVTVDSHTNSSSAILAISATARTKSIVAPTDQVTERTIAFRWRSPAEATEANLSATGQIGDYVTGQYAANTNNLTQCTTRPTQTDADMSLNGFQIFTRAYNAASTAALPARFVIKIAEPNEMSACEIVGYKDTTKTVQMILDRFSNTTTSIYGLYVKDFNPATGILTLDTGNTIASAFTASRLLPANSSASQDSAYITFTASKLAQGVAIPTRKPYAKMTNISGANFTISTAWQPVNTTGWVSAYDSHSAFNPSESSYTAPEDGIYLITSQLVVAGLPDTAEIFSGGLLGDGLNYARSTLPTAVKGNITIRLVKGEKIFPTVASSNTGTFNLLASISNYITITKIGEL